MHSICRKVISTALASAMAWAGASALAAYPDKEIKLTVAYAAGGVTDVSARLLAKTMEKDLKQPLIIFNRAGAQATMGPAYLAKQDPDGYNAGVVSFAPMAIVPHMLPVSYTADDFSYVG
ncbi:MAG: Tripartite tricarboxylate transporter family receptor, partial [Rhizobacter sp.]|nr:Tripartite tricarboxylate transporter family receptor [Rhizobacter sp.]